MNNADSDKAEYVTLDEAADLLKVHPDTIRRRIRKGRLPGAVLRPDKGILGTRERYFIPRSALSTPFEVKDVVPVERGLSLADFETTIDTFLRTRLGKQKQDIVEAVEHLFTEQSEQQREQRAEQQQHIVGSMEAVKQTLLGRLEQQDELIKELTAQVAEFSKPGFWGRLRRKPKE